MATVPLSSPRPRLRPEVEFRPSAGAERTELLDPVRGRLVTLSRAETALASVMDGSSRIEDLAETASALGLSGRVAAEALVARLREAGCLDEAPPPPNTALVPVQDESFRRALVLVSRGIDGPARRLLQHLDSAHPGRPGVQDLLAVLDEASTEMEGEHANTLQELHDLESQVPVLTPPTPGYTARSPSRPAVIGRRARRSLVRLSIVAAIFGVMAVIPNRSTVYAPAQLRSERVETIRALGAGIIDEVLVQDGASVRAGQSIARLRNPAASATVEVKNAELASTLSAYRALERGASPAIVEEARAMVRARGTEAARITAECRRVDTLVAQGVLPRDRWEACQLRYAEARSQASAARARLVTSTRGPDPAELAAAAARITAAERALAQARAEVEKTTVRSPVMGRLIASQLADRRGAWVRPGDVIAHVVADGSLLALIQVAPGDVGLVTRGAPVVVRARALGVEELHGRVGAIASRLDVDSAGDATLLVRAQLRLVQPQLVLDLPVTAEIEARRTSLLGATLRRFAAWVRLRVM